MQIWFFTLMFCESQNKFPAQSLGYPEWRKKKSPTNSPKLTAAKFLSLSFVSSAHTGLKDWVIFVSFSFFSKKQTKAHTYKMLKDLTERRVNAVWMKFVLRDRSGVMISHDIRDKLHYLPAQSCAMCLRSRGCFPTFTAKTKHFSTDFEQWTSWLLT